jgi:hypothetical protein
VLAVPALAVFAGGFPLGGAAGPPAPVSFAAGGAGAQTIVVVTPAPVPAAGPATVAAGPPATVPVTQEPSAPTPEPDAGTAAPEPEPVPADADPPVQTPATTPEETPAAPALPPVKHVWFVVLSGHGLQDGFGPDSHSALLRETLPRKGLLLLGHRAVAGGSLANGLALITGRDPSPEQAADCPVLTEGCLVPADQQAITDQLTGAGLTWRAYVEGSAPCPRPAPGAPAAPRNPFVYVHSIAGAPECAANVVGLDALDADLADPERTPAFSYVVPDACHDGRDVPCAPGALAGTAAADGWLRDVLRRIRRSAAYRRDGLVVLTFDHGPPGAPADAPVGALLLSHFLPAGTTVDTPTDHVTLLKTVEDLFGLGHLGRAAEDDVPALGADVLARPAP